MDEFFNCGFSVMIRYVQHLCASGTNAWVLRYQSTSCWCAACAIVSEKSPNRKEIWREISWFWQGNLTGKKEILHSKREISWKHWCFYGSTGAFIPPTLLECLRFYDFKKRIEDMQRTVLANKIYMKIDNVIFWSNLKDYWKL
jgi:hypothetical protein